MQHAPWIDAAKSLKPGGQLRMVCQCAPHRTPSLRVEHCVNGALRAYCFRCKDPGMYVPPPHESLAEQRERAKALRAQDAEVRHTLTPPAPLNLEPETWPLEARVWLYKAGLSDELIVNRGIYWHEPTQRVVIPVVQDDQLTYWQARGFAQHAPKYINPRVPRDHVAYEVWTPDPIATDVLVLTEDILSALRVGEFQHSMSLLGTDLKDPILARVIKGQFRVLVWLDPDEPGQQAAAKLCHRLAVFEVPHYNVVSEVDPKLLHRRALHRKLEEAEWRLI